LPETSKGREHLEFLGVDRKMADEMGRACSTNVEEECIQNIGGNARRKETSRKTKT
jgi:hypothetical protein